jgi:tRNA-modifying protein YgfZ
VTTWASYMQQFAADKGGICSDGGIVLRYGDVAPEYAALATGPAIVHRADRAIVEVSGVDRATWLHNLTTNVVKTLGPGDGNYSFATNVQGRILFDLNVIIRPDVLRLDIDRCFFQDAIAHFDKYIIMEDVALCDRSGELVVFGISGDRASDVAIALGASQMTAMADINSVEVDACGVTCLLVRNNYAGQLGFDLHVPTESAIDVWTKMVDPDGSFRAKPTGTDAVQLRRIEAGIPWSGVEITSEYLPAETMQFDRAVSFQKGCYLGQEIIERMRTRDKLARRLVQLDIVGESIPNPGSAIVHDGANVGTITSAAQRLATGHPIALGYVKTAASDPGTSVTIKTDGGDLTALVAVPPSGVPVKA